MKLARFLADVYDAGLRKFQAGKHYAISDETARHVALGNAQEVDVQVDLDRAQKLADKARAAAVKAEESARLARADADAAAEAQRLLDEADAAILAGQEAGADEIQRKAAADDDLRAHAAALADQADAAAREADAALARSQGDPADVQLHELAESARTRAAALKTQAEQGGAAAQAATAELQA